MSRLEDLEKAMESLTTKIEGIVDAAINDTPKVENAVNTAENTVGALVESVAPKTAPIVATVKSATLSIEDRVNILEQKVAKMLREPEVTVKESE